jgi:hypothetical protein
LKRIRDVPSRETAGSSGKATYHFFVVVAVVVVTAEDAFVAGTADEASADGAAVADTDGAGLAVSTAVAVAETSASGFTSAAPLHPPRTTQQNIAIIFFIFCLLIAFRRS